MRIAVIGATGNVGTALLRRLHAAHDVSSIVGISRRGPDRTGEPYSGVEWRHIDISDPASSPALVDALRGADAVVHLAWVIRPNRDEDLLVRTNVEGSRRVFEAAAAAGVPHLVHASSVGAYGRADGSAPGRPPQDESFPTHGCDSSHYARQKAQVERILDEVSAAHPEMTVSRLRPGLIFQEEAGPEIRDYFLGVLVPPPAAAPGHGCAPGLPLAPRHRHAGCARRRHRRRVLARGPPPRTRRVQCCGRPVVGPDAVGSALGARRWLPVPTPMVRALAALTYRARLQPTDPGWIDMAVVTPVMSTERIHRETGWSPRRSSIDAIRAVVATLGGPAVWAMRATAPAVRSPEGKRYQSSEGSPPWSASISTSPAPSRTASWMTWNEAPSVSATVARCPKGLSIGPSSTAPPSSRRCSSVASTSSTAMYMRQ